MASGRAEETFDMDIVTRREFMPGDINVYRFMDRNGRLVDPPGALSVEGSGSGLRLKDFKLRGSLTLAFKIYPPAFPVTFDFSIDGRPALQNTHLGRNLTAPKTMPFSEKANRAEVTSAERPAPPQPPYALVWCQESRYHGETGIKLDEETKKELRALGYIQ
jgi:hypothetical protein